MADRTYVEPLDPDVLTAIIERERPDALLPTLGGQTALNLTMALSERGVLEANGVEVIGANPEAIATAEDRERFKAAMEEIGLSVPASGFAHSLDEAMAIGASIGYPIMVRPSYILGGAGTGIAPDAEALVRLAAEGLDASPISEVLVERSIAGQKEYELEVMRDHADNCVVICSIENFDPMGVHTGDSITVAPAQTLTDVEYQEMRDAAFACIRRVGVETGGSNVQFAVDPRTGHQTVIEMNPRVSRSSALASKATGFPIAKIAARLAVGYRLDEIPNDITGATPASFEPVIDYVVTKIPRWAFEKLPGATDVLGTRMQSVGEVMGIGRTFPESLQKAVRSLEQGRSGLNADAAEAAVDDVPTDELLEAVATATPERLYQLESLLRRGVSVEELAAATGIDPWFLAEMAKVTDARMALDLRVTLGMTVDDLDRRDWRRLKRLGFSDAQLAHLLGDGRRRGGRARRPGGRRAPPSPSRPSTPVRPSSRPTRRTTTRPTRTRTRSGRRTGPGSSSSGRGPTGSARGSSSTTAACTPRWPCATPGFETIMLNCNPETVSTDYDTSDRLYFEPLTPEDLANVIEAERAASRGDGRLVGVIVSLGGQTPLKLAAGIDEDLVLGTSPASIDLAEDRERWNDLCGRLGIPQPPGGTATTPAEAVAVAGHVGYPVLVRPSYVLGGRAMEIVYDDERLVAAVEAMSGVGGSLGREGGVTADRPVLVDRFLEDAVEVDVDAVRDATGEVVICGVMEHVEEAGVHSGDSACALPPQTLSGRRGGRARAARPGDLRGPAGARPVQRPVRREGRPGLRARGQPAGQPDRALRGQGHRRARGHGGGPGDGGRHAGRAAGRGPADRAGRRPRLGQGGGPPLQPLPGGRHAARPGDALDRRGDGHRRHVRPGLRQEPDRRRQPAADVGHGLLLAGRPGQGRRARGGPGLRRPRLRPGGDVGHRGHAGRRRASTWARWWPRWGRTTRARSTPSSSSPGARSSWWSTPRGAAAPGPTGCTSGPPSTAHLVPCLTTVAAAKAAAAGIADWLAHPLSVRSLQEYHQR